MYIPPNLVNPTCIGTSGYLDPPVRTGLCNTNSTYPIPYENAKTNSGIADWCPWDLQVFPPEKPGDGVYPYPDDNIQRPIFDPCKSACAAFNRPEDCCTLHYHDPNICVPSLYSKNAKALCPDAYTYAFDDQTSTFVIPSGGGWEVVFCPSGRSSNIQFTFQKQLKDIAAGIVDPQMAKYAMSLSYIESQKQSVAAYSTPPFQLWPYAIGAWAVKMWLWI